MSEQHAVHCANRIADAQREGKRLVFVAMLDAEVEFWRGDEDWREIRPGQQVIVSGTAGDCVVRVRLVEEPEYEANVDPVMLHDWREVLP